MSEFRDHSMRRPWDMGQKGLTLIELLVTIIILSMAAVLAAEAIRLGRRTWERQHTEVDAEQRIRVIYGIIAQAIAATQPVTEMMEGKRVLAFEGSADRIVFYARPDRYQPFPYNAMVRSVSFSVDREKGMIMHETYPLLTDESSRSRMRIVDPKVSRIRFRYLPSSEKNVRDLNWVERWIPMEVARALDQKTQPSPADQRVEKKGRSDQDNGLPVAVEVSVTITQERRENTFNFLLPLHVGGYL